MFNIQFFDILLDTVSNLIPVETLSGKILIYVKPSTTRLQLAKKLKNKYNYHIHVNIIKRDRNKIIAIIQKYKDMLNNKCILSLSCPKIITLKQELTLIDECVSMLKLFRKNYKQTGDTAYICGDIMGLTELIHDHLTYNSN
jgi:hypothetical protein